MPRYRRRRPKDDFITATEIACYAYCPEQWRLEYGLKLMPENTAARDIGTRHHDRKAAAERVAGWAIGIGQVVAVVAVLMLLAWLVWR